MEKKKESTENLLIGAHTSAAGGAHRALLEGKSIGATTVQFFTANQKRWKAKPISEEAAELFKVTLKQTGLRKIMSHGGYLINLGSPDPLGIKKSRHAFAEEIERCLALGITFLNFHPGAALNHSKEQCLNTIVESLLLTESLLDTESLTLLLETTAGQGSAVGSRFEEIGYIVDKVHKKIPIGVCIDTCHIFAAGYDIRTAQVFETTLAEFDKSIGLKYLKAFHLNDSVKELGSCKDRHAPLGEGKIGIDAFKFLMTSSLTRNIPKYLETPGGCPLWDKEIWMLREFARGKPH